MLMDVSCCDLLEKPLKYLPCDSLNIRCKICRLYNEPKIGRICDVRRIGIEDHGDGRTSLTTNLRG